MFSRGILFAGSCYLLVCCGPRSAQEDLLATYAGIGSAKGSSYLTEYARAQKLKAPAEKQARQQAYLASAFRETGKTPTCSDANCIETSISALGASDRSKLFDYAVFHLADGALRDNQIADALGILRHLSDPPESLQRKTSLLKGRLLQLSGQAAEAAQHFRQHLEKFKDGESLYLAADAFDRADDKRTALATAIMGLEHPEADFAFAQNGLHIRNLLGQAIYTQNPVAVRIRLMEALRVAKDKASAAKLFQSLVGIQHGDSDLRLFVHYGARLMLDKGDARAAKLLLASAGAGFFEDENEKAALDVCERLIKKKQFALVRQFFSTAPDTKTKLQCQLRLAQRSSDYSVAMRRLAGGYIASFDAESTLAERIYLRSCLPDRSQHRSEVDIACLEELRRITAGKSLGAGARYFLARHFDAAGDADSVKMLLTEIATQYADDYYFYRLIENPLVLQKQIAAGLAAGGDRATLLTSALFHADLALARNIEVTGAFTSFAARTLKRQKKLDGALVTAALLFAADSRDEARELLRNPEKLLVYENLVVVGQVAGKSDIALFGVKQWLREQKLRPFIYEIPLEMRQLLYPMTYTAHVEKYAAKNRIEVSEVMALIRQESQFFAGAISRANALGLMQLLPSTAKLVASKEGLARYNLLQPEDNIRLGTAFMRDIKDHYSADFVGLAIAYNAGPGRYVQWKKKLDGDEAVFVEQIPFQETYHYVRVLLSDRAKYRALLKNP